MVMGLQPGLGNAHKVASGDGDAVMKSMMPVQERTTNFASAAIDVPEQTPVVLQRRLSRRFSLNSPGDRDDRGWTPLHVAARRGDLAEVRRLIDGGANVNEPSTGPKSPGCSPLHLAAAGGHIDVMDELLERGADIEARTRGSCGWTPLHNAAKERKRKAVRFLLENGAFLAPDMTDGRFNPPLHYCPGLQWAYKARDKINAGAQEIRIEDDQGTGSSDK
jgi:hypothetical protein